MWYMLICLLILWVSLAALILVLYFVKPSLVHITKSPGIGKYYHEMLASWIMDRPSYLPRLVVTYNVKIGDK